jgi:hypothetical protein
VDRFKKFVVGVAAWATHELVVLAVEEQAQARRTTAHNQSIEA